MTYEKPVVWPDSRSLKWRMGDFTLPSLSCARKSFYEVLNFKGKRQSQHYDEKWDGKWRLKNIWKKLAQIRNSTKGFQNISKYFKPFLIMTIDNNLSIINLSYILKHFINNFLTYESLVRKVCSSFKWDICQIN